MPVPADEAEEYTCIPLACVYADTVTGFTIYLRTPPDGNNYVFYREANLVFSESHRAQLTKNGVTHIYIHAADRKQYLRYLENHLDVILQDPNMPVDEKSQVHYSCATELVKDVFDDPRSGESIKRVQRMVNNSVYHILQQAGELSSFINIMSVDYHTYTHSVNVCVFGVALGHRFALNRSELRDLGIGLLLHDVGKSEIDSEILSKEGPLNNEERDIIKSHPQIGFNILADSPLLLPTSLEIILRHHERRTGRGYPGGLRDHQIHPFAKIAALVDVFDALTTRRPYHAERSSFAAFQLMQRQMKDDFDPDYFRELIRLLCG
ncbi:HD-GYP domain-containing protein [Candidatus Eisenbacteria bacterium]|uniref:HD-GYP domain-containing protein n=1 Tax=Eiseniibacteriota bacterium TaxID=2212470 RepID=A0ABV6YLG4_UNCEI